MEMKHLSVLWNSNIFFGFDKNDKIKYLLYTDTTNQLYMLFGEAAETTLDRRLFEVTEE